MRTYTYFAYKGKEGLDFEEFITSLGKPLCQSPVSLRIAMTHNMAILLF